MISAEKKQVLDFWDSAACGELLLLPTSDRSGFEAQAAARYRLEPCIVDFAQFHRWSGKRILEIGVGLGADHQKFAQAGADPYGIDLTERAVELTRRRLLAFGLKSQLAVGDAEQLAFPNEYFDIVYSWGVIHHSPDTPKAVAEIWRVLRPGGEARIMIYHKWSLVGLMLWVRYALLALRPWRSLSWVYAHYLESPGTKAYSVREARKLFAAFRGVRIRTILTHGDLLESAAGQRHRGPLLSIAGKLWPRTVLRRLVPSLGLFMLIEARKETG